MNGPIFDEDWIRPDGKGGVIIGNASPVPGHHVSQIVAWIYEAAGKPNPIVLPRCDIDPSGDVGTGWYVNHNDGTVTFRGTRLSPDDARMVAAIVASTADIAENEPTPDPAEVERLAAFLGEQMDTDPTALARRLLGAFDVKERAA